MSVSDTIDKWCTCPCTVHVQVHVHLHRHVHVYRTGALNVCVHAWRDVLLIIKRDVRFPDSVDGHAYAGSVTVVSRIPYKSYISPKLERQKKLHGSFRKYKGLLTWHLEAAKYITKRDVL